VTPAPLVYGAYTQNELDDQYDTALTARIDVATYLQRFAAQSEAARADFARTTFAYGSHHRNRAHRCSFGYTVATGGVYPKTIARSSCRRSYAPA
jgi:hypothetical protein